MPVESDPADSPLDPTKLVLLVDLANFRPRDGAEKVFLQNRRWRDILGNERTNLQYIDRCLQELADQAPGSLVISFCDRNIKKSLETDEDWKELERRNQLSIDNPNRVFFLESKEADKALVTAANELGSPIVSHDDFAKEQHSGIVFEQSFDVRENAFRYTKKVNGRLDGTQLLDWWVDRTVDFTYEWLESADREAAEALIRQRVRDCTFEFLWEEELTQRLTVPDNALEIFESRKREREAKREQRRIAKQVKVKSVTGFTEPETVVYADEWSRIYEYQGRVVTLIGRLVDTENGQLVEWFKNFQQISIIGATIPATYGKDRFVAVTGRLEEVDGVHSIHLDPTKHVGYPWFADVVAERPIYLQDEDPFEEVEPERWRFPSFLPSLTFVRRLRSERMINQLQQFNSNPPKDPEVVVQPSIPLTPPPKESDVSSSFASTSTTLPPIEPEVDDLPSISSVAPELVGDEEPNKKARRRGLLLGVGIAVVVALGFGVSKYVLNGSTSDTVPGRQITGATPCPKTDGTEERATKFEQAPAICIDPAKQYTATFNTSEGVIEVALDTKKTPLTVNNFVTLSRYKYYDTSFIFRTDLSLDLIQGGGSNNTNSPGYSIKDEGTGFKYTEGDLVMARSLAADSGAGQFFFATGPKAANLNPQGDYVTFGKITKGLDVAQAILGLNVGEGRLGGAPSRVVRINTVVITES